MDDLTVAELLALGEPPRLLADVLLGLHRRVPLTGQTLTLGVLESVGLVKELLRLRSQRLDGLAECKKLPFGVAHQRHEDAALPPALAAKTPHDLFQFLVQTVGLAPQADGPAAASLGETFDELKRFF